MSRQSPISRSAFAWPLTWSSRPRSTRSKTSYRRKRSNNVSVNRRTFIKSASLAAAGSAAGLRPFGALNALAQSAAGYKALVCVFLYGGNDANNTLIQFDTAGYANYASVRGPLALPQSQLLQLSAAPNFALHPGLPDIQALFDSNAAALVANVGTLVEPTNRTQYLAG